MDIEFNCDKCGQQIVIEEAGAGLTVQCPKCNQSLLVPSPKIIEFNCGNCGQWLSVDEEGTGLTVPCPKCHTSLLVPASNDAEQRSSTTVSSQGAAGFYVFLNREAKGPYTLAQIRSMWIAGDITNETPYCEEGESDWKPFGSFLPAPDSRTPPPPRQPTVTKTQTPPQQKRAAEVLHPATGVAGPAPAALSPIQELEKLAQLRDRGIVTKKEFQAKKRQLLGL